MFALIPRIIKNSIPSQFKGEKMARDSDISKYSPGMYDQKKQVSSQIAEKFFREWIQTRLVEIQKKNEVPRVAYCICFSRKIGVGALEIADRLAEKNGFQVVDREILEHIAQNARLEPSTVELLDECYPGAVNTFISMLFGEKSFIISDYIKHLALAIYSFADSGSTIFVGRAAHLILPREKVLAVRFISSMEHRARRVAQILQVEVKTAQKILKEKDKVQRDFFKKIFQKKEASPSEFDLVINCDYLNDPEWAADIVYKAYRSKFRDMII